VATHRYYVLEAGSGQVTRYAQSMQAYTEAGYRELLSRCGYEGVCGYASLTGDEAGRQAGLCVLTASRSVT
jgi:hypothetical protein